MRPKVKRERQRKFRTMQGKGRRMEQQDAYSPHSLVENNQSFVLCDGVGGSAGGKLAAHIVANSFWAETHRLRQISNLHKRATRALHFAKSELLNAVNPNRQNMSTTLSAVLFEGSHALAYWIGDTRIYHLRSGKILWKSEDHNLAYHMVQSGVIEECEKMDHHSSKVLLRSVSPKEPQSAGDEQVLKNLQKDDHIILASDGVFEAVMESDIALLSDEGQSDLVFELIEQQCTLFSNDNFTLIDIHIN